ncbi:MAG TPA: bifunctional precorrin-2 dehydrogenase/sirohydrochlorin ferrochelatase [Candidatus Hydrogenedentes bacterium]|nr:bifunctional precorrin-2 dehydrogenase/sirohydrochlorin ferrochelatase [Candidatus Hydrogenedentota bacterium]
MGYLPVFLNLTGRDVLVAGGGAVALRKAESLLEAGARVTVVSPVFDPAFDTLAAAHPDRLRPVREPYTPRDLSPFFLAIAATDDPAANAAVAADAERARVWVNVVDVPELCTVLAAATFRRGPVQVAVCTGGECPALGRTLRDELAEACPETLGDYAAALGVERARLKRECPDPALRARVLDHLARRETRDRLLCGTAGPLESRLREETGRFLGEDTPPAARP